MRNKLLILAIIILIGCIVYINFSNWQKTHSQAQSKPQETEKIIKSLELKNSNYNLTKSTQLIAQRKSNAYETDIYADSYILIDKDSGQILAKKNENYKMPIASTTKIMTAIIALENYNLNDTITISNEANSQIGSTIYLGAGQKFLVMDVLYDLLVKSGNDGAYALAEKMGVNKFIDLMNQKAKYLGIANTHFLDPAGLDDQGFSTAYDLAYITKYALKNEVFRRIISTQEAKIYSINDSYEYILENSNRLILPDELFYLPYAIGVKTGNTPDAGHCLVSAAVKDNHTLISVILHTDEDTADASAKESKKLLEWGFDNFEWKN